VSDHYFSLDLFFIMIQLLLLLLLCYIVFSMRKKIIRAICAGRFNLKSHFRLFEYLSC